MTKPKHPFKKRYIFCLSAIVIMLISYFVFLCVYARNYTMSIYLNGTADLNSVRVECSSDNIVKVTDIRIGNLSNIMNLLEIDLESVHQGNVDITVYYEDSYDWEEQDENNQFHIKHTIEPKNQTQSFHVSYIGTIWCSTLDRYHGIWTVRLLLDTIMIVIIITFTLSFIENLKKGDFTYSMVTLSGLIFFMSITVALSLYDIFTSLDYRSLVNVQQILISVISVIDNFIQITLIPLVIFCLLLSISNIGLVRHEGFRIQNLLGFMLGILVIGGIAAMYFISKFIYLGSVTQELLLFSINASISFIFCYMECLLIATVCCALMSTKYKIKQPMDYIIILGCAIRKDGSPTPILRGRIDRALAFDKEQAENWNKCAKFVPSGDQGSDEVVSEAESMKRYLMEQGIPEERILKEDKSVNTYQNMAFSKKVIEKDAGDLSKASIAFSTTNYHVFRGYTLAKKLNMSIKGLSAKTKLYFFPNAFLREFIGLIVEQKKRHLLFILLGIVFFASLYLTVRF